MEAVNLFFMAVVLQSCLKARSPCLAREKPREDVTAEVSHK